MGTVSSDEGSEHVALHYEDEGEGRPVVLIHGWPLSGASWSEQVPALLDAGYRVITYDRRGFGESDKPDDGYSYDHFARDLHALMNQLDLEDATLVGFSMGGGEVCRYIGTYGEDRIRSAVLAAAVPPYLYQAKDNPEGGLDDGTIAELERGVAADKMDFVDHFLTDFFSVDGELKVSEEQRLQAVELARPASEKAAHHCVGAFSRTDFRDDLEKVTVPLLVIHGDSDAIVPFEVSGKRSAESVASSELVLIADAPHGLNVSHAEEFNRALLDFLG